MRLAIWSTTTPRENSTCREMFQRQLEEVELAERIGIDQIWFFEHHLSPSAPVPSPNLLIAAAAQRTRRIRFSSMVNILPFRHPLLVAEEAAMLDNLSDGRLDMGLGRGLRPPEFEAFGVDQQQSRAMFLESFEIIRRVWADENFVHHGKYWTVHKDAPLAPPLVQRPHPPFLVSTQSAETLRWAAQHDIPFAQIDSMIDQARGDQALYRDVQTAHGHTPVPRFYLMREIYVAESDARARAEAKPYLLQYWDLWNRYTQFTHGGSLPDSYDFWRRQAPMLHAMSFDEIVANDMVILGSAETVANTILRLASEIELMGLAMIFKLGAMPYTMVERSMRTFGEGGRAAHTPPPRSRRRCSLHGRGTVIAHRLKRAVGLRSTRRSGSWRILVLHSLSDPLALRFRQGCRRTSDENWPVLSDPGTQTLDRDQ